MNRVGVYALSFVATVLALVPGCGGSGTSTRLEVFAAASLAGAFEQLADDFEAAHPDVDVRLTLGGSSSLARQIIDGAEADVFVSADEVTMSSVIEAGKSGEPVVFARNELMLLVEPGNPMGIFEVGDLADSDLVLALCAPAVPCGRLAAALLARAGVEARADSLEPDVRGVTRRVALGEADVGVAYASEARAAGRDVQGVEVRASRRDPDLQASCVAAVVQGSRARDLASSWVRQLRSKRGQRVLQSFGFLAP